MEQGHGTQVPDSATLINDTPGTDLDQIAQQLRAEIESLEDHIQRTTDRFLATQWASELIDPFEQLEDDLDTDALREAVQAMYVARARFKVNGHLAERIDAILERHDSLIEKFSVEDTTAYDDVIHETPEPLPHGTDGLFEDDEEDSASTAIEFGLDDAPTESGQILFSGDDEVAPDNPVTFSGNDEVEPDHLASFSGAEDIEESSLSVDFVGANDVDEGDVAITFSGDEESGGESGDIVTFSGDDLESSSPTADFGQDEEVEGPHVTFGADSEDETIPPAELFDMPGNSDTSKVDVTFEGSESTAADSEGLFDASHDSVSAPGNAPAAGANDLFESSSNGASTREASANAGPAQDKRRAAAQREKQKAEEEELFAIFSHKVSLDDLQAALDITIPPEDVRSLENQLRARLSDRVVNALRSTKVASGQYILLPRIPRFVDNGTVVPCTVKNLARRFHQRFGDIRDLMRYRNDPMMTSEIPEPGWALITPESPRESLGKNYMEQNQYLRYLATSLTIPSHLLRRRTLVEGIYDLIVGQMVLGKQLQKQSLDWTTSSPAKNDFVCVYHAPEGIRVRDLSRTTHHPSLGVCPNW
mgnify:CR=1 FL=1|jgi:hypothetical protein